MKNLSIAERQEIKDWQQRGDVSRIAKEFKITTSTAYSWLNGKYESIDVKFIAALIDNAAKNKKLIKGKMKAMRQS